jgi:hypothetical protein
MSGLFKRLSSRRSAGPEGTEPPTAAEPGTADVPATTPAEPEGHRPLFTDPAAQTRVLQPDDPANDPNAQTLFDANEHAAPVAPIEPNPYVAPIEPTPPYVAPAAAGQPAGYRPVSPGVPVDPVADLPAGLDPDELAATPATSARRGRLRRRAAFLRAARELLLRDLGGFVYELHRTAHDVEHDAHRRLRETKLARLSRVDAELHELEIRLDDVRRQVLVREPGVGGECPHCGELFGSAAHYCSNCGLPLTEGARRELARSQQPQPAPDPVIVPAAAPVVTGEDQPTQEIPPLGPDHPNADPDFQWPRREGAEPETSWATTPSGPTSEPTTGETAMVEADAAAASEAEPVEVAPEAVEAAPATAETGDAIHEPATSELDVTPASEAEPAPEPVEVAAEPSEPAPRDDEARNGTDATPEAAGSTPERAAGDVDSRNGSVHDDSILRPVERRP